MQKVNNNCHILFCHVAGSKCWGAQAEPTRLQSGLVTWTGILVASDTDLLQQFLGARPVQLLRAQVNQQQVNICSACTHTRRHAVTTVVDYQVVPNIPIIRCSIGRQSKTWLTAVMRHSFYLLVGSCLGEIINTGIKCDLYTGGKRLAKYDKISTLCIPMKCLFNKQTGLTCKPINMAVYLLTDRTPKTDTTVSNQVISPKLNGQIYLIFVRAL